MLSQEQLEVALKAFAVELPAGTKVQALTVVPRVGQADFDAKPVIALVLADREEDYKRFGQVIDRGINAYQSEIGVRASFARNNQPNQLAPRVSFNIDPTAEAVSLNPVRTLKDEPDFVIDLLVQTAGGEVAEGVKAKAKEVALAVAGVKVNVHLLDLVEAFDQVPELKAFAARLRKVALPGAYAKNFD